VFRFGGGAALIFFAPGDQALDLASLDRREGRRALGGGWAVAPVVLGCGSGCAAARFFGCPTRFDATRVVGRGCRCCRLWLFGRLPAPI